MEWPSVWAAIISGAVVTLLAGVIQWLRVIKQQNELQLAKQRRIDRDLFGEDPDNPSGVRGPSLRELVVETNRNTQGLPDRVVAVEVRQGRQEDRLDLIDRRLTLVEDNVWRKESGL